jgi:hypothetical protein
MTKETANVGDAIGRYFERVLGARHVGSSAASLFAEVVSASSVEPAKTVSPAARATEPARSVCLLIEVGAGSDTPSIQEMGTRLVEAIRNEWLKHSVDHLPQIEWIRTEEDSWASAVADAAKDSESGQAARISLAIVCGAHGSLTQQPGVIHVSSFAEMQASHIVKRESWRAMQQSIASAIRHSI